MTLNFLLFLILIDCDKCEQHIHAKECKKHIFKIIVDNAPKKSCGSKYAVQTLPANLCVKRSLIPNAGKGVFTKERIKDNTRFGPYTGERIDFNALNGLDTSYMWEVIAIIYVSTPLAGLFCSITRYV